MYILEEERDGKKDNKRIRLSIYSGCKTMKQLIFETGFKFTHKKAYLGRHKGGWFH